MRHADTTLFTELAVSDCIRRLEQATTKETFWGPWLPATPFLLRNDNGVLRMRVQRPFSRNSFAPILYAEFDSAGSGTRIHLRLRLHPLVRVFMVIWFSGAALGPVITSAAMVIRDPRHSLAPLTFLLVAWIVPALGYGLLRFGQRLGRKDGEAMIALVRATLEAREVA